VVLSAGSVEMVPDRAAASVADLVRLRAAVACDDVYLQAAGGGCTVTYGELDAMAGRWSAALDELGVGPGGVVAIVWSDPVELAAVILAALAAGRAAAPFDHSATDAELRAACSRTSPEVVISDRPAPESAGAQWITMMPGEGFLTGSPAPGALRAAGTAGIVLSTSGTTGLPKVIRLHERQLLHTATSVARHFELTPSDRCFNALPLFHINAEVVGLLATLASGAAIVLDDRFHRRGFWAAMTRQRITWINAVPAILARLALLETGERVPGGVRFARSASAPLPVPVLERFERTTRIPVVETYGMTEASSQITANPLRGGRKAGSVGLPVGCEVRVVTSARAGAEPGVVGKVEIRGPGIIGAYVSPGYEDRIDTEGWLDTGDLGHLDEAGYLFLAGRADDLINRGGEKIYPREVEDAILADPAVSAVVVIGGKHDVLGQVPVAYLVAENVDGIADADLAGALLARVHDRCAEVLSRPKRPAAYHLVDRLPQGPTGKVRRNALPEMVAIHSLVVS